MSLIRNVRIIEGGTAVAVEWDGGIRSPAAGTGKPASETRATRLHLRVATGGLE